MRYATLVIAALCLSVVAINVEDASSKVTPIAISRPSAPVSPSDGLVAWCDKWRSNAIEARRRLSRARSCFDLGAPASVPRRPSIFSSEDVWQSYGLRVKRLTYDWNDSFRRLREKMSAPGGTGAERWRPLVRWHWPESLVETALYVISRESGGSPGKQNTYSGAGGLFQLCPAPAGWRDPDYNVWYAYHRKYVPAGGWGPWSAVL